MKTALALLLVFASEGLASQEKIGYVYELVRHGARAPSTDDEPGYFRVPTGMLTEQGMRQRYLLGRYNRIRYIDKYGLLDNDYNKNQLYIESTDVPRTIQSSYSELLGMYPPKDNSQLYLTENESKSLIDGKGLSPIKIRMSEDQRQSLYAGKSVIDNYVQIPVYNYGSKNVKDDINYISCHYLDQYTTYYFSRNETFKNVSEFILPVIRDPIADCFGISEQDRYTFEFGVWVLLCDLLVSENFEGNSRRYNFTDEEWYYIRLIQKYSLTVTFDDKSRSLYITKQFRRPIAEMKRRVTEILNGDQDRDTLRYLIYSAHDVQVANVLTWLQPVDHELTDVPYASTMFFELHYDEDCVNTTKNESCFSVLVTHNGSPIKFSTCLKMNQDAGSHSLKCTYEGFLAHIESVSWQGDVLEECAKSWTPPSLSEKLQEVQKYLKGEKNFLY